MDTTPTEGWSLSTASQTTASVEASLCVARRFGIFEDIDDVDHALEVEMRAALTEFGLRAESIEAETRPANHNPRHTLVLLTARLTKHSPKPTSELKHRLLYLMKDIELRHRRAYAPYVSLHGVDKS